MHSVELWTIRLGEQLPAMESHWLLLDDAERRRAARYRQAADRARFVVGRATLRRLLGSQLRLDPRSLVFYGDAFGKPALLRSSPIHFNSSHSGEWVLHALSASGPVGVDVEAIVADGVVLQLQDDVLALAERDWLQSLQMHERPAAFTDIWVRKESYVKALGQGLSRPLREISVLPARGGGERLSEHGCELPLEAVSLCPLELGPGYAGCLAYLGPSPLLRIQHYLDAASQTAPSTRCG